MIILETERLLLRCLHVADSGAMEALFTCPEVMKYDGVVRTPAWVQQWLRDCLENYYRNWGFGPWAVVEKSLSTTIGYTGLFYFPDINGKPEVEIGYRFMKSYWGCGYATEAARGVKNYAHDTLCISRLVALIHPENHASIRVAQKIGMAYETDVMLEHYTFPDRLYVVEKTE